MGERPRVLRVDVDLAGDQGVEDEPGSAQGLAVFGRCTGGDEMRKNPVSAVSWYFIIYLYITDCEW